MCTWYPVETSSVIKRTAEDVVFEYNTSAMAPFGLRIAHGQELPQAWQVEEDAVLVRGDEPVGEDPDARAAHVLGVESDATEIRAVDSLVFDPEEVVCVETVQLIRV